MIGKVVHAWLCHKLEGCSWLYLSYLVAICELNWTGIVSYCVFHNAKCYSDTQVKTNWASNQNVQIGCVYAVVWIWYVLHFALEIPSQLHCSYLFHCRVGSDVQCGVWISVLSVMLRYAISSGVCRNAWSRGRSEVGCKEEEEINQGTSWRHHPAEDDFRRQQRWEAEVATTSFVPTSVSILRLLLPTSLVPRL